MNDKHLKVLVIEDNPADARLIQEMLTETKGVSVELQCARRLSNGLAHLSNGEVDLVLLDLSLPDSQGLDTLHNVKAHAPQVPIVILSGLDDEELAIEAIREGAQDYLVKGQIDSNLVGRSIRYAIERKRMEEARYELDRMKSEFISNISHELRSPLHSIRGFSNLMLEGKVPDPETQKEFLTIIDRQSEHLSSLVDNLLDTSRLEAGQFSIQKRLTPISNIIHSAVETFYTLADEKGITITEDIPPKLPEIEVDEERLKQVMMNLLSNAIKFTEDTGPVTVKVEARNSELLVQVADHGIGIPEEAMPHLFERFQQAAEASRIGGAGLGLHISRQIIEAHSGRIWGKSKEGEGSTFYFTLPLGQEGGDSHE